MPMHDWTRVEARIYHDFHSRWLITISNALNSGVLPSDHYALVEQVAATAVTDVLTLQRTQPRALPPVPAGVVTALPRAAFVERARRRVIRRSGRRLAIRHVTGHRVVAVAELVSPGNKSARRDLQTFFYKYACLLDDGVHVLIIDPLPPVALAPNGLHPLIWSQIARRRRGSPRYALPPDRPLSVLSYAAGPDALASADTFAVGQSVPDGPPYLNSDDHVTIPLEAAYQAAFAEVPAFWRDTLTAPAPAE